MDQRVRLPDAFNIRASALRTWFLCVRVYVGMGTRLGDSLIISVRGILHMYKARLLKPLFED